MCPMMPLVEVQPLNVYVPTIAVPPYKQTEWMLDIANCDAPQSRGLQAVEGYVPHTAEQMPPVVVVPVAEVRFGVSVSMKEAA